MLRINNLYSSNEGGNWRVMAADENGSYTVADMCCDDQEKNANLFAAAPDLLAALQEIAAIIDSNNRSALDEVKAAIDKAHVLLSVR